MKPTLRGWLSQTLARAQVAPMIAIAFLTLAPYQASGQTYITLHAFTGKSDGGYPLAPVILDSNGNLYGTTFQGGDMKCAPGQGCGTVFKIDPSGKETVVYAFKSPGPDAAFPAAGVVRDASGNLFGTTTEGGTAGIGTVFEVNPSGKETILYSFKGGNLGAYPTGAFVRDAAGNIYGTGSFGDFNCDPTNSGCGVVFKLTSTGKYSVLHAFHNIGKDGEQPSGLFRGNSRNLYGTTLLGGDVSCNGGRGCGTVFKIDPRGKLTTLYKFHGRGDGAFPTSGVIQDSHANLYGTTSAGTSGVVFKLDPTGHETVLYTFTGSADGGNPEGSLLLDPNTGTLYGTTEYGGDLNCNPNGGGGPGCGTVYQIDASGVFAVLYAFTGNPSEFPFAGVMMDRVGNLYGTTTGTPNCCGNEGSVFRLAPNSTDTPGRPLLKTLKVRP
jgi:uncharacterized repeat protein (TIGR03803 family)